MTELCSSFKKLRDTDKIKPKKKAEYQELVADVPNLMKQPSRPLTELLNRYAHHHDS